MKLGDLVDGVRRVEDAEKRLHDAQQAVRFGGCESTMQRKHAEVSEAEEAMEDVRNEELEPK